MTVETFGVDGTFIAKSTSTLVECIGKGGNSGIGDLLSAAGGGGGGGAYAADTITTIIGHGYTCQFENGGKTKFNTTSVVAEDGSAGQNGGDGGLGGAGGLAANSTGTTKNNGGTGGNGHAVLGGGGGGGASGRAAGAGSNGSNGTGVGGAGGATGSAAGTAGRNQGDATQPEGNQPGGGTGGCSDQGPDVGVGGTGRISCTYTSQVNTVAPILDEDNATPTPVVNALLDPDELLTATPGQIIVAPIGAKHFNGFELVLSQATAVVPFSIKDTNGNTYFTLSNDFPVGSRINIHTLPIPIDPLFALVIEGGEDNAIFNGNVFWSY